MRNLVHTFALTLLLGLLASCGDDPANDEIGLDPPGDAAGIFGYCQRHWSEGTQNFFFTAHTSAGMGDDLAGGQWSTDHHWRTLTRFDIGARQYVMGHGYLSWDETGTGNQWWIKEVFSTGDVGAITDSGTWGNLYKNLTGAKSGNRTFIFGQRSGDRGWFVQEVKSGGVLGGETQTGYWTYYYDVVVPLQMEDRTYIYFNSSQIHWDGLDSQHKWFISELTHDGRLVDTDSGFWENFYPTTSAFEVGGWWYIFGHRKPTLGTTGHWFIQHVRQDGTMGSQTDAGTWNNYYKTIASYKAANGKTYLFGQNTDYYWFIQEVLASGQMGSETDSGTWGNYYRYVFPFTVDSRYLSVHDWMGAMSDVIGDRQLIDITLPASHDAGVNTLDYHLSKCLTASSCNTVAQDTDIHGQLMRGSRYFDVRPAVLDMNDWSQWWTGHFGALISAADIYAGCRGETMAGVFDDVNEFFADPAHAGELVILKISHCLELLIADVGISCEPGSWNELKSHIEHDLQHKVKCDSCDLMSMTLNEILELGNVIVLVDGMNSDKANGIFSWGAGDLPIYDEYSNSNDLGTMKDDQRAKLVKPSNHDDELFLLSWTLTMNTADALECPVTENSILKMADPAHDALFSSIDSWIDNGTINQTIYPNIIYIDAFDQVATHAAMYLNNTVAQTSESTGD